MMFNPVRKLRPFPLFSLFCFVLFILVIYFGNWNGNIWGGQVRENDAILLAGLAFFAVVIILIWRKWLCFNLPYPQLFAIFLFNLLIMALLRGDIIPSLRQLTAVYCTIVIVLFLAILLHSMSIINALFSFSFTVFVALIFSVYVHLTKVGPLVLFDHGVYRFGGLFFFAHSAMLLGGASLVSLFGILQGSRSRFYRLFFTLSLIVMVILLPFTDTRSIIFSFALCAVGAYFISLQKITLKNILVFWGIVIITIFAYYYFTETDTGVVGDSDVNIRLKIWDIAWQGILNNPFLGYGKYNYLQNSTLAGNFNQGLSDPHSAMLSHGLQFGLISLILFMSYYVAILIRAYKYPPKFKPVFTIGIYWIAAPFFWGHIYDISGDLIQIIFLLSIIGIMCHPDAKGKQR